MNLEDFLIKKKMSKSAFSRLSGVSRQTIYMIIRGYKTPDEEVADKIEKFSNGEIKKLIYLNLKENQSMK